MSSLDLTLAKQIADSPREFSIDQIRGAIIRLEQTAPKGARRTQRAWDRLDRRLAALRAELTSRGAA